MTFFNNYKKTQASRYYDATQIGDVIYAVGKVQEGSKDVALITKVGLSGQVIWEKSYVIAGLIQGYRYEKVIACSNGDLLVTGRADDRPTYLIVTRIAPDGSIVWQKYYSYNTTTAIQDGYVEALSNGEFCIVIVDVPYTSGGFGGKGSFGGKGGGTTVSAQNAHLILISATGVIISQAGLQQPGAIYGTSSNGSEVLLYGKTNDLGACYIYNVHNSIALSNQFTLSAPNATSSLFGVVYQGQELVIRGLVQTSPLTFNDFITRMPVPSKSGSSTVPVKVIPGGEGGQLAVASDGSVYLNNANPAKTTSIDNELFRFAPNLNAVWSKKIEVTTTLLLSEAGTDNIIMHSADGSLMSLNLAAESCKTIAGDPIEATNAALNLGEPTNYNILAVQFFASNVEHTSKNVTSQIEEVCPSTGGTPTLDISNASVFQSSYLYLQSVGSTGEDSTQGMHLRWLLRDTLGEKHLPKGDLAKTTHNFNKPNDVVSVYRAPYQKNAFSLSLFDTPTETNDSNATWVYRFAGGREFHVYFHDVAKYNEVRATINPLGSQGTAAFINAYGARIIEVENKAALFFAVDFVADNTNNSSRLLTESLSVSDNDTLAVKVVSARQTFTFAQPGEHRIVCENGRSVRFQAENCVIKVLNFELYSDFIVTANEAGTWQKIGDHALTLDDNTALERLESAPGAVHGVWKRYNEDAFVNTNNYIKKWNRSTKAWDRNIKEVVSNYVALSDNVDNPTATEQVPLDDGGAIELSNLDLLNLASYDYHVARLLGLGCLDTASEVFNGTYVYLIEYTTLGDLGDGQAAREVHHLAMSLPTSVNDQRLPLPVELKDIVPGAFFGNEGEAQNLTDEQGYTESGKIRYVSLYAESQPEDLIGVPFYQNDEQFSAADYTDPVYAGLEHRTQLHGGWNKPELSHDINYYNASPLGGNTYYETRPLQLSDTSQALYVHKQTLNGTHYYSAYGINWFSRATPGNTIQSIETLLQVKNPFLSPSNVNPLLIRSEKPLLLTSDEEQQRLDAIPDNQDKTLIRLTFDYHSYQDMITQTVPVGSPLSNADLLQPTTLFPDDQEVFAEEVEIFFRNQVPENVTGKVTLVNDHPSNDLLSIVQVDDYYMASVGKQLSPVIAPGTEANYVGGTFIQGDQQYIIQEVVLEAGKPVFTLYKKEIGDALVNDIPSTNADELRPLEITGEGLFMAVENMQNASSWGTPNPLALKVNIGQNWGIHREVIGIPGGDQEIERQVEKSRGIWANNAIVTEEPEIVAQTDTNGEVMYDANGEVLTTTEHRGSYKITFPGLRLTHPQHQATGVSVEWFRGIARIFTQANAPTTELPKKTRKVLQVIKIENIGNNSDLVVYINDASFSTEVSYDPIQTGNNISVNFYPGYKVYLYADNAHQLNEANILPAPGEKNRYSIFGLRSRKSGAPTYVSKISVPSPMFAQELVAAEIPEKPLGTLYATRPDFFGRSTYTFTTEFKHKPHGVLFYRASDEALLNALYEKHTIQAIKESLATLGGKDETYFSNRWNNFLNFEELANDPAQDYQEFEGYRFPNPDKAALFDWANTILTNLGEPTFADIDRGNLKVGNSRLIEFVKGAIYSAFVPLTRVPVLYQYIKGSSNYYPGYEPENKPQVIRDRNGHTLSPEQPEFDMAPMAKVVGTSPNKTQFTDFNLDGTTNNAYFYGVRETSSQMKMGDFSPFLGPVKLVNTNPPEAPEVKSIIPQLGNLVLETPPAIQLEINAYPAIQKIKKLNIYRAFSKLEAQSVRTMQLVDTIDLAADEFNTNNVWQVQDTFADLVEVPYGEGLFYRVTVAREVAYANKGDENDIVVEYAPSQASKIVASMMVEVTTPPAPVLSYTPTESNPQNELNDVVLHWNRTCYKGKYHVYKMNARGNWVKIYEVSNQANMDTINLPLQTSNLASGNLALRNSNNEAVYHHFKVVAENTTAMLSTEEKILTIGSPVPTPIPDNTVYELNFNGSSSYLESQPGFTQWGKSQAFTMQFFVKDLLHTQGSGVVHNPLFCSLPNGSGGGMIFGFRSGDFIASIQATSSKFNSRLFARNVALSDITHVALSYAGGGVADGFTLYLNGVAQAVNQTNNKMGALEDAPATTLFTLCRGYSWVGGTNYTQGKLQNFSVVNYEKTAAEIQNDMNNGTQSVGTGAYLLAYDFNIPAGNQSTIVPGGANSPDLNILGATFIEV